MSISLDPGDSRTPWEDPASPFQHPGGPDIVLHRKPVAATRGKANWEATAADKRAEGATDHAGGKDLAQEGRQVGRAQPAGASRAAVGRRPTVRRTSSNALIAEPAGVPIHGDEANGRVPRRPMSSRASGT
jgi:hypothetical protein